MSRYIDLDKLLDAMCIFSDTENGDAHFMNGINTAIEVAESMAINALKEKIEPKETPVEAYKRGYTKGYLDGYAQGEKDGMATAIKAYAHMQGEYGEGKDKETNGNK